MVCTPSSRGFSTRVTGYNEGEGMEGVDLFAQMTSNTTEAVTIRAVDPDPNQRGSREVTREKGFQEKRNGSLEGGGHGEITRRAATDPRIHSRYSRNSMKGKRVAGGSFLPRSWMRYSHRCVFTTRCGARQCDKRDERVGRRRWFVSPW